MDTEYTTETKSESQTPSSQIYTAGPKETKAQEAEHQNQADAADHAESETKVEIADVVEPQASNEIQYVFVECDDHVEAVPQIGAEITAEAVSMEVAGHAVIISNELLQERHDEEASSNIEINSKEPSLGILRGMDSEANVEPPTNAACEKTLECSLSVAEVVGVSTCEDMSNSVPMATETNAPATNAIAQSGLGLLSQYLSDSDVNEISDTESVVVVPTASNNKYRNKVVEIGSDSDSSSSDSSDSDVEYLTRIRQEMDKRFQNDDDVESGDDDQSHARKRQPPKVKGEMLLEDLPPIQDLHITVPEEECVELGRVHSIVEQLVLVSVLPESLLLNLETVLFLEKGRKVLGEVFDVLGQVVDPLYCIRFNSNKQIHEKNIKVGDVVYVAPKTEYTQFVILSSLQVPGSDASWKDDVEPPPRYLDYSDDEEEREARRQLRRKKRTHADEEEDDCAASTSSQGTESSNPFAGGPRRGRRENFGSAAGNHHARNPSHSPSPQGYRHNYNRGSWHSNYGPPPHPGNIMRSSYAMPPGPPHMHGYPTPPPMRPYAGSHFAPPMQHRLGPHYQGPPPMGPPPMFGMNPYAVPPPPLPQHATQHNVVPTYPPGTE